MGFCFDLCHQSTEALRPTSYHLDYILGYSITHSDSHFIPPYRLDYITDYLITRPDSLEYVM